MRDAARRDDDTRKTEILLVRHGQTASNVLLAVHGQTDVPLTEEGERQAELLAAFLAQRQATHSVDAIYASPLRRAHDTALAIGRRLGLDPRTRPDLMEIDLGAMEGYTAADLEREPEVLRALAEPDRSRFGWPGGERFAAFHARARGAVADIAAGHEGGRVVVVSHGGLIASLVGQVTDGRPDEWLIAQCGDYAKLIARLAGIRDEWPPRIPNCSVTHLRVPAGTTADWAVERIGLVEWATFSPGAANHATVVNGRASGAVRRTVSPPTP